MKVKLIMTDKCFAILCSFIGFILSILASLIIEKCNNYKLKKERKYSEFYRDFYIFWNKIHQGRAYDFVDLKMRDREKIVSFLLEHYYYAPSELQTLIYELKTNRLDNFNNNDENSKKVCNESYRKIIDYMVERENKYRKKYNNLNY